MRGPGALLTDDQGALGPLTHDQGATEPLINIQEAWASNQQARGYRASNWQPETQGPLTDVQGSRARGSLMQIFNNLYAKPVRNLRVLI